MIPPRSDALTIRPGMSLRDVERLLILATLATYPKKAAAAAALGISMKTLYSRIREYEAARAAVARGAAS